MIRRLVPLCILAVHLFSAAVARGGAFSAAEGVVGSVQSYPVTEGESLMEVARRFDLGYNEIAEANPDIDPFIPAAGTELLIPTAWIVPDVPPTDGIVINLSEMRLYFFFTVKKSRMVVTYPIGIGDEGTDTPVGVYRVTEKVVNPSWHVPRSIKLEKPELPDVVPPGPDNPLGSHAMRLSGKDILIHGTNKPWGVGRRVSHGCIRLYPEDIPRLFDQVSAGTMVTIVRQPVKVGMKGGRVYLEAHRDQYETIDYFYEATDRLIRKRLMDRVDAAKLFQAIGERKGVPVDISN